MESTVALFIIVLLSLILSFLLDDSQINVVTIILLSGLGYTVVSVVLIDFHCSLPGNNYISFLIIDGCLIVSAI